MESEHETFVTNVNIDSNQEKVEQFLKRAQTVVRAVEFNQWLDTAEIPIIGRFLPEGPSLYDQLRNEDRLESLSFLIALLNAWLMIVGLESADEQNLGKTRGMLNTKFTADWCNYVFLFLGVSQVILSVFLWALSIVRKLPTVAVPRFYAFAQKFRVDNRRNPPLRVCLDTMSAVMKDIAKPLAAVFLPCVVFYIARNSVTVLYLVLAAFPLPLFVHYLAKHVRDDITYQPSLVFIVVKDLMFDGSIAFNTVLVVFAAWGFTRPYLFAAHLFKVRCVFVLLLHEAIATCVSRSHLSSCFPLLLV